MTRNSLRVLDSMTGSMKACSCAAWEFGVRFRFTTTSARPGPCFCVDEEVRTVDDPLGFLESGRHCIEAAILTS